MTTREGKNLDIGLESFLHLIDPSMPFPQLYVNPNRIDLKLERGTSTDINIEIRKNGRGFISGSIELTDPLEGVSLTPHIFCIGAEQSRGIIIKLKIETGSFQSGHTMRSSITISSNAEQSTVIIPLILLVEERQKRVSKVTSTALKSSTIIAVLYCLYALDRISITAGMDSPLNKPADALMYIAMGIGLGLPLAMFIGRKRLRWYGWLLLIFAVGMTFLGFVIAEVTQDRSLHLLLTYYSAASVFPFLISIIAIRLLYHQDPYKNSVFSIVVPLLVFFVAAIGLVLML